MVQYLNNIVDGSFFNLRVRLPLVKGAQTCKKESFFIYADDTDSMNGNMKWI